MVLGSYNTFTSFAEEKLKALNVYDINMGLVISETFL